ncbi:glycoside hydrolase family 20 protein, partial [Moniliophthora roreri]
YFNKSGQTFNIWPQREGVIDFDVRRGLSRNSVKNVDAAYGLQVDDLHRLIIRIAACCISQHCFVKDRKISAMGTC